MDKFSTPPQLAKRLGVSPERIIAFINDGRLRAVNLSDGLRPRWRVSESDWAAFLESRSNVKPAKKQRRRKCAPTKDYFA